jgi:spore coat protein A
MEMLEGRVLLAVLLDPFTQPKFVNPLPFPGVIKPTVPGGTNYNVSISQFSQQLGLYDPVTGEPLSTTVWGYNGSYPGPTFEARKGVPINVTWSNDLVDRNNKPLPHLLPVDTSINWAFSDTKYSIARNGVPVVTHLHGGHTESASDGLPEQWFTPKFKQTGPDWVKKTFTYANDQDAATLWYHDHALGITRLNVYAGLAGFYLLRDPAIESAWNLPSGQYEIPLAIQDRMFTADGQLYYPSNLDEFYSPEELAELDPNTPEPSILTEFLGDFILVNGQAWPFTNVEPRKYRFRLLNGSDSRFYNLFLSSGQSITQIGSDEGYLAAPTSMSQLTIGPGERADVVIDFSGYAGQTIIMRNNAKAPFPAGGTVNPNSVGQIMAFKVGATVTTPDAPLPTTLNNIYRFTPQDADNTRQLGLFEMTDQYGRLQPMLGTVQDGPLNFDQPVTETPLLGDVELWEVFNTTGDTHPIHLHGVSFQILDRQKFSADVDEMTGAISNIRLIGTASPPPANEAGWKDTAQMSPGEVTRILVQFNQPGKYAWHCHILSHEDHDMMRPLIVRTLATPAAAAALSETVPVFNAGPSDALASVPWQTEDILVQAPLRTEEKYLQESTLSVL